MASSSSTSVPPLHHLMGSKLRSKMGQSLREQVSAPTSDFARKQLEKMGWTQGTGLGKHRDGIATHVSVKKRRQEQAGLGTEKLQAQEMIAQESNAWWQDSLSETLAKLGGNSKKSSKKKGSTEKKRKKRFTDEELFEATGGMRFGMRAAPTRNLAKWRRTEAKKTAEQGETAAPSSSTEAAALVSSSGDDDGDDDDKAKLLAAVDGKKTTKKKRSKEKKAKKKKKSKKTS